MLAMNDPVGRLAQGEREQAGARAGLDELLDLIDRHALIDFLAEFHPFVAADVPESPAMERVELGEADLLWSGVRASW
jgi:hypothetical protein